MKKKYEEAENEAKQKGYLTKSEDLKGYPIATLNSPEVIHLKNGYQNAFSHYLSGFLYEAVGEWSLATASYRTAIELQPSLSLLKESLLGLDERNKSVAILEDLPTSLSSPVDNNTPDNKSAKFKKKGKKDQKIKFLHEAVNVSPSPSAIMSTAPSLSEQSKDSDVLFVIESGVAPLKKSVSVPLPIPYAGIVPISFPDLEFVTILTNNANSIILPNNTSAKLTLITSIEHLSRRSLAIRN
jgi:tetratricopeptide (TPR) repeat protein